MVYMHSDLLGQAANAPDASERTNTDIAINL